MGDVTGVHHEVGLEAERVDLVDRGTEGPGHVGVGGSLEAQVAVAHLDEPQCAGVRGRRGAAPATWLITSPPVTVRTTAAPNQAPCRMSCRLVIPCSPSAEGGSAHETTTVPVMNGWIVQW